MTDALDESEIVAALRRGDDEAFGALIDRHYIAMLRVARLHVSSREAAEDVVQDTFLALIRGIDDFEERASLRTWMFHILVNRAKSVGQREHRTRPFSSLATDSLDPQPSVEQERFVTDGRWAGFWQRPPLDHRLPESSVLAAEMHDVVQHAVDALAPGQQAVVTLRDIEGFDADEVCEILGLSETNQRVLLHRARTSLRSSLESYLDDCVRESP